MTTSTRALIAAGAVTVLAAGIGIGTALSGSSKSSPPPATTAAAATATSSSTAPANFTLTGIMTLKRGAFQWDRADNGDTPCTGLDGYSDITAGTSVVVTDQAGTVIATGQLDTGDATIDSTTGSATVCTFALSVPDVPYRPFYGVTVSHRGAVTYSTEQAKSGQVALTLG